MNIIQNKQNLTANYAMLFVIAAMLLSALSGCGIKGKHEDIHKLLIGGRKPNNMLALGERDSSFGLTKLDNTLVLKTNGRTDDVLWATFDITMQPPISEDHLATATLDLALTEKGLFHLTNSDLAPLANTIYINKNLVSVSYARLYHSIPVRDSFFEAIYWKTNDGTYRLREVVNNSHGEITLKNPLSIATSWLQAQEILPFSNVSLTSSQRLIFSTALNPDEYTYSLATEFTFKNNDNDQMYTVTFDDDSGTALEAYGHTVSAAKILNADVFKRNYKETTKFPKPLANISLTPTGATAPVKTNIDGQTDLGTSTGASLTVANDRVQILLNTATTPMVVNVTTSPSTGATQDIIATDTALSAINAFSSVNDVNRFIRKHLEPTQAYILTLAVGVKINVTGSCNAFFDPGTRQVSLFAAGGQCANTADINDVAYHEWGHGLDDSVGKVPGITDGAFSEGIGDIISSYLTGSPDMGVSFFTANLNPIRQLSNSLVYPTSLTGEVHDDGRIIGGAFWDMRAGLIAKYGETKGAYMAESYFINHLLTTDSYKDSYTSVLRLDSTDGNPATLSPNHCIINAAFAKHGLATAENCQDAPSKDPKIDNTLIIASQKSDLTGVTLMAAVGNPDVETIDVCIGNKSTCLATPKADATLIKEGIIANKIAFTTTKPITIKAMDIITLIGKGKDNGVITARMFKFVNK